MKTTTKTGEQASKILNRLADMDEVEIDGVTWTKMKEFGEFKVSPFGAKGDYDRDASWVSYDAMQDQFAASEKTYQVSR